MKNRSPLRRTLALALCSAVTFLVPISVSAPAHARGGCDTYQVTKSTSRGQVVWVPSTRSAGPFQFGGSQSISVSDGEINATTKGSSHTVGGSGGVKFGIGEASAHYDRQWNKSTSKSTTMNRTFTTNSPTMPRRTHWRWRLYVRGWKFTGKKTLRIPTPCTNSHEKTVKIVAFAPTTKPSFTFAVERYKKRNMLLNKDGKPIPRF